MTATAAPAMIDGLLSAFRSALVGVDVDDGYTFAEESGTSLTVGVAADPDAGVPSFSSRQSLMPGMGNRRDEVVSVACRLSTFPQGTAATLKAARDHLAATLTLIDTALRADHTLGGVVEGANLGADFSWFQGDSSTGDRASVVFTITGLAYL